LPLTIIFLESGKFYIEEGINESNVEFIKQASVEKLSNLTPLQNALLDLQISKKLIFLSSRA
jgi:hypothetical protein